MNYRMLLLVCTLLTAFAFSAARAQGVVGAAAKDSVAAGANPAVPDSVVPGKATAVTAAADTNAVVRDTADDDGKSAPKGLDLDRLLSGDHPEEDLLVDEKPAAKPAAADSSLAADTSSTAPSAGATTGELAGDEKASDADAEISQAAADTVPQTAVTKVTVETDSAGLSPLAISDGRTINFAQNLKEYRSPRIAMLLSLLVPGLGQAYSRNYVKTAAFGAAEVAVIGVAAYLNSVGKAKKRDAHRFADEHFDVERMRGYNTRLRQEFERRGIEDTLIFNYYDSTFYNAAAAGRTFYYESIRDMYFTPGWDDNDPSYDDIFSAREDADTIRGARGGAYVLFAPSVPEMFYFIKRVLDDAGRPVSGGSAILGLSENQAEYNSMINNSNSYYDAVNYVLYALLLNHIASAVDAGFTARAYNARLLGGVSALERVSVGTQYVFTGSELSPGIALRVRF